MVMTFDRCYHKVACAGMLEGCTHQDWLWDHLFWSSNAHFTAWIWVITWTSLMMPIHFFSKIWLDGWEELFEENIELTTMSLSLQSIRCMSEWRDSSMIMDDHIYLNGVSTRGSFRLVNNLDGCWHDAHNQSKDNPRKNLGEKILHNESSSTTLGGMVKLDEWCEQ